MTTDDLQVKEATVEEVKKTKTVKRTPKDRTVAPKWCPNAVASARGWEDPETGELYVSNKTLPLDKITAIKVEKPKSKKKDESGSKASTQPESKPAKSAKPASKTKAKDDSKVEKKAPAKKKKAPAKKKATKKKAPAKK